MIKLLLDEGVHLKSSQALRDVGVEALHVIEIGLTGSSDETILAEAVKQEATLVCLDSDFHKILARTQANAPTVIRIRAEIIDPVVIAELLVATLQNMPDLIEQGAAISIDLDSARGRRLPLK